MQMAGPPSLQLLRRQDLAGKTPDILGQHARRNVSISRRARTMKWSTTMRGRIIVMTVAVGMLVITQSAATPGITVQKNTVEIVTRCGSSSGHDFYLQGGLVSPDRAGWSKGRISSGQILLIHNGNEPDIIFTDATKQIQSARSEGATVIEVQGDPPGFRLILAVYQGSLLQNSSDPACRSRYYRPTGLCFQ